VGILSVIARGEVRRSSAVSPVRVAVAKKAIRDLSGIEKPNWSLVNESHTQHARSKLVELPGISLFVVITHEQLQLER
jgi:hypothetical protein